MPQVVIENSILTTPFVGRRFRLDYDGITDEIVASRRISIYRMPIPPPKMKGKQLRFETEWTP